MLRKALRDAVVVDQLLVSNPVERAKRPRNPVRERREVSTSAQLRAFLEQARRHRLFAFYHLAAYTGARCGELLNLRWRDVDLAAHQVRISGSAAVVGGARIEGTTKTGRSRTVSIDTGTVHVLREHRSRQAAEQLAVGTDWRGTDDYVFATGWGEPVHPDTVSSLMADLIRSHNRAPGPSGRATPACSVARSTAYSRHNLAAGGGAGPCARGPAGPCRSVDHIAGLCSRDPGASRRGSRHLRAVDTACWTRCC